MDKPLKRWDLFLLLSIVSFSASIGLVHGLECYVCSSDKLEDCSTLHSIEELPLELCPADVASCFTRIEHGKTIRGCLSHYQHTLCDTETCVFCRSNKCNAQIFPEDRLSCLHCEGPSCVNQTNTIEVRYPCAEYDVNDECYSVFSYDGRVAYRGCISDKNPNKDFCIENHAQCNRCKKRACNSKHVQFEKELSCVKCHPDENSNCNVVDTNTTATECARTSLGYENLCYTLEKSGVSYRGCLYEASDDIFVECNNPNSEACLTCNQTDCNRTPRVNEDLTLNPFHYEVTHDEGKIKLVDCGDPSCTKSNPWERFCYKCDSNVNPNCANELDDTMIGMCDIDGDDLGCYHMITDAGVVRGCVAELEGEMKQKCMENDDSCKTCLYGKCNSRASFLECLVTDEDQIEAPNSFESLSSPKICQKYDEKCFIQVVDNDKVVRGCVNSYAAQNDLPSNFLDAVENKRTYEVCSESLCNDKEVKPMHCVSCNSTDKNCVDDPNNSDLVKTCSPIEVGNSGCYHFNNGSYVERGCISELDENQRVKCESDSDTCKKCLGNQCNARKKFLRCIYGIDGEVFPISKECRRYDDECFILVKNATVIRGSLNEFDASSVPGVDIWSDRQNPDIYDGCSTPDCNDRKLKSEYCTVCSSEDEEIKYCRYGPTIEMRQKCPIRVKKLGCYLQETNITVRGCVAELSQEERSGCGALNDTCKMCEGENCNKKRHLEKCKVCSSESDENCISRPWLSDDRICPNYMDQCYTHINDGVVKRGCTGDDFISTVDECINSEHCSPCTGIRCNGGEKTAEVCIVCDSDQNATCKSLDMNEEQFIEECPLSIKPQGCYHFIDEESGRHVRGCVSALSTQTRQQLHEKPDEFKICTQPKCNSLDRFEKCLVCDSAIDPDCATNPNISSSKVCDNYKNTCFTRIFKQNVVRGCLNDIDEASGKQCRYDKEKCEICSGTVGCNNSPILMDTCIDCDTLTNEECRLNPKQSDAKICFRFGQQLNGCFLGIVRHHLKRGCIQDVMPAVGEKCLNGTSTCKSCFTSNCNSNPTFHECYSCNSRNDPRCAREYTNTTEICESFYGSCITGIDEEGFIHRGCDKDHKYVEDGFLKEFKNCSDTKCNSGIFPENRLRCYQCNGNEDCDFVSPNSANVDLQPQPCAILSDFDQCFTYINEDKKVFRGCLSDSTKIRLECEGAGDKKQGHCVKCTGSGCNDQPKVKPAKLSCVKCSDTEECAFGHNSSSAITCLNDVTFGDKESCFVHKNADTSTTDRGCTLDVDARNWCHEENGCEKCLEKGCNTKHVRHSWCLRCHSDTNGNCAKVSDPNEFTEECAHSSYAYSRRGCYTAVKGGKVTRGCIIDLNGDEYENCQQDQSCDLCLDDQCNKKPKTNSGLSTSASYSMCLCVALITCFRLIH